jgi:hypothetical protein
VVSGGIKMKTKQCCGNCLYGEKYGFAHKKRIRCNYEIPEIPLPDLPSWAFFGLLEECYNSDLTPSVGKDCPVWKEK